MQDIVKTKGAKKVGGVMVDMFTASVITKAYEKMDILLSEFEFTSFSDYSSKER